jgi:hypothetical protein
MRVCRIAIAMGPKRPTSDPHLRFAAMAESFRRTHVQLTANQHTLLRYAASSRHVSVSFLIRQLVDQEARSRASCAQRCQRTRRERSDS